ncbi:MAG: TonB-dependent receptor [Bacteroidia bacterium]|nr:TonB-dependent receptor [Bacteroidia bacterium]
MREKLHHYTKQVIFNIVNVSQECGVSLIALSLVFVFFGFTNDIQGQTINGTVKNNSGQPLSFASIIVKGTSVGTTTDFNGKFSLNIPTDAKVLVVNYVGYERTEVDIAGKLKINIVLKEGVSMHSLTIIGSRGKPRSDVDRPDPVDIISIKDLNNTAQADVGQALHYTTPSFSAVKFGINDLAPLVDPASLRGLAPDQILLLVNGKRRHKVSFFSLNNGIGKGQLGNDINAIPSGAIKRVEVLRDGAAAQYGSDAIAGVINMQLNDARSGGSVRMYLGTAFTKPKYDDEGDNSDLDGDPIYGDDMITDGETFSTSVNFGNEWGDDGFINTTLSFTEAEAYDRSGTYTHSAGWYSSNDSIEAALLTINGIDLDRAVLGGPKNTNGGIFINAGKAMNDKWNFYAFGGVTKKEIVGGVFSRSPTRTTRSVLEIFPNGYNPEVPSELTDAQFVSGAKGEIGNDWILDVSTGHGHNDLQLFARNTVNPSMGSASPTQFFTGALNVSQTLINADASKSLGNTTIAFGTEMRWESFEQSQGQIESWLAGPLADSLDKDVGSAGREGFTDRTEGRWTRRNTGIYAEVECDITEAFLMGGAIRIEDYSDFGSDVSFKAATRYWLTEKVGIRASANRSFRAPALAQVHYSNFSQIAFDNAGNSVVTPFLPSRDVLAQEAFGLSGLEPESSFDLAAGVTAQLNQNFSLTADFYNITIDDRIMVIGGIDATAFPQFNGSSFDEIDIFANLINTTTTGFDFVAHYKKFLKEENSIDVTLAANFNTTTADDLSDEIPDLFKNDKEEILESNDVIYLIEGTPKQKIILTGNYRTKSVGLLVRFTQFGEVTDPQAIYEDSNGNDQQQDPYSAKIITDLAVTGFLTDMFSISLGINNIFDVYPEMLIDPQTRGEVIYSRRTNQFGTQGRFASLTLTYDFK